MTDDQEEVGGTIIPKVALSPGLGVSGKTRIGERVFRFDSPSLIDLHTLTSAASLSAEIFSPDQSEMVDAFLAALEKIDNKKIFLLAEGTMTPRQVGIETDLKPNVTQGLAKIKRKDIENAETREHEIKVAKIGARGPLWVKILEWGGWIVLAILFGAKIVAG